MSKRKKQNGKKKKHKDLSGQDAQDMESVFKSLTI